MKTNLTRGGVSKGATRPRLTPAQIFAVLQLAGDAPEGASLEIFATRAAGLTGCGATPVVLDRAGSIQRPPEHSSAWATPAKTADEIRAALKEESGATAIAIGGLVFQPGRRFVSRLMFAPKRKRQAEQRPSPEQVDAARRERENVNRVLAAAGFANSPQPEDAR